MVGEITYTYKPQGWDQERFLSLGGFVVVFLNYNKLTWISDSVASALNQDYPLLEMFFMDDASTDGSGDEMERIVREYRGRHKVTVVRNAENQHIAGQWNIVSRLATGTWLGMFCGDDISHLDRVSRVAERLAQYPSALGIWTASRHFEHRTGRYCGLAHYNKTPYCIVANESNYHIIEKDIDGATSFYHISLFERPLTKAPLDDCLMRWILMEKKRKANDVVCVGASDLVTVDYTKGSGISSIDLPMGDRKTKVEKWHDNSQSRRSFARIEAESRLKILEFFRSNQDSGISRHDQMYNLYRLMHSRTVAGTCLSRITLLPTIVYALFSRYLERCYKKELVKLWLERFLLEIFGLRIAAKIGVLIHPEIYG